MSCKLQFCSAFGQGGRSRVDALQVDEEVSAIGAIRRAREGPVCLIQIQVTSGVLLYGIERNCIGSIRQHGCGRLEIFKCFISHGNEIGVMGF